jgi:hypothetical protein
VFHTLKIILKQYKISQEKTENQKTISHFCLYVGFPSSKQSIGIYAQLVQLRHNVLYDKYSTYSSCILLQKNIMMGQLPVGKCIRMDNGQTSLVEIQNSISIILILI